MELELGFKEPETFEAPDLDGNMKQYIIYPVQVETVPKLIELTDLRRLRSKLQTKKKVEREKPKEKKKRKGRPRKDSKEDVGLEKVDKEDLELAGQIGELANMILDECVLDSNKEPLPLYHRAPGIVMTLMDKVIEATNSGSENPDPLQQSTPEKKS